MTLYADSFEVLRITIGGSLMLINLVKLEFTCPASSVQLTFQYFIPSVKLFISLLVNWPEFAVKLLSTTIPFIVKLQFNELSNVSFAVKLKLTLL